MRFPVKTWILYSLEKWDPEALGSHSCAYGGNDVPDGWPLGVVVFQFPMIFTFSGSPLWCLAVSLRHLHLQPL